MTFNYQLYDTRNLDDHTRRLIVQNEIDAMLDDQKCIICSNQFIGRKEKDNAFVADNQDGKLTFAHDYCWEKQNTVKKSEKD